MTRAGLTDFQAIVAQLQAQPETVARRYAPNGRRDGPVWRALNPGRADRSVGSFWVNLAGPHVGRWRDEATGEGGDMLDLIQLALGCDRAAAVQEARAFLGIAEDETPEQRALRRRAAERAARQVEEARAQAEADAAKKRARARGLWMGAAPIENTPAAAYLTGRCVGIGDLGRAPNALRFVPRLRHYHEDEETGEVFEGEWPAMVAAVHGPWRPDAPPELIGAHITWLAPNGRGGWGKAPVPKPKKVRGQHRGGFIRLWSGWGPRGGKGRPIAQAREGARLFIAEGIEDALSAAVLLGDAPDVYIVAALNLGNMEAVELPPQLTDVTIIADQDPGEKQRAVIERAAVRLAGEGRRVGVWRNHHGGKDLNDALRMARAAERKEGAA
ncbi:toprim domain-containing protein [Albimonas sp. CAU 1670]|uniref:DUF7146 domain-containing protein n=1 Tax=Albimonas sp. CAU 1670 TaxID=3032599 RepID=UPI0023DCDA98|nr:toprim domain-containing protein [Albimonas sp. CAU 1670]MDF2235389.1 toprim domain-containing protein [Albimonas sp. CAU 1670]